MKDRDSLGWGASYKFVAENAQHPTFFSYIDPGSAIDSLRLLNTCHNQTTVLKLHPIVDTCLTTFEHYMFKTAVGRASNITYPKYVELLAHVCDKHSSLKIPSTTIRYLKRARSPMIKRKVDGEGARFRFNPHIVMMGSDDMIHCEQSSKNMNVYESKLTMCILPLCYYLGYKTIYLMGFDGIGGRFFDSNLKHVSLPKTSQTFLKRWVGWKNLHGMDIINLVPPPMSILNNCLPYQSIEGLIGE